MAMTDEQFMAAHSGAGIMGPAAYTNQLIEGFVILEDTVISVLKDSDDNDVKADRLKNITTLKAGATVRATKTQRYFKTITIVSGSINDVTSN